MFRLTFGDDRFFHQGGGGAGLDAGPARHAIGVEKALPGPGGDARIEAPTIHGQGKSALDILTGAHTAVADDAFGRIIGEIGIAGIGHVGQMGGFRLEPHLAQPHGSGHILQFAIAVGRAGQAIQRVIRDIHLHDAAADAGQMVVLGHDLGPGGDRSGARGRTALAPFDFHQTQSARAIGLQMFGGAQAGNGDPGQGCRPHDRGAFGHGDGAAVDLQCHQI